MSNLEKALEIAVKAHTGMKDKTDQPYILHPIRVMMGVEGESAQIVAILHDVVEDTDITLDDLRQQGFTEEVIAALNLVTHQKNQSYADYVIACKGNTIARQVKLSDLRDNSNINRMLLRPEKFESDTARIQKYVLAYRFLTDAISVEDYRRMMAKKQ